MRIGAGAQLHDPAVHVPPQELLLPRHAQGVPDQPVRPAAQRRRLPRPARRQARRHRARPPRGGHRQEHPRRRHRRSHPRQRALADRLQPRRRAAGRDRQPARHPHAEEARQYVTELRAHPRRHRRQRREDGGGQHALSTPTSACTSPARRSARAARSRTSTACARSAGRSSTRHAARSTCIESRRDGAPGDPPLGRERRPHAHPAHARRTPTTTATSSSPTSCRWRRRPSGSSAVRDALPMLPAARRARLAEATGVAPDSEAAMVVVERGQDDYVLAVGRRRRRRRPRARPRQGGVRRLGRPRCPPPTSPR